MVRNVISIITGLVVGFIVTFGIQMVNYGLFPLPEGLDPSDTEAMMAHVKTLPTLAFVIVFFSHIAGSFLAALTTAKIADTNHKYLALGLGAFFMLMGIRNLFIIPHPTWFAIVDCLVYLPAAYLGYIIGAPRD